ncbi:MAG: CPXCG motif-containing cysteine-rich protein [Polyangiales bacterium]
MSTSSMEEEDNTEDEEFPGDSPSEETALEDELMVACPYCYQTQLLYIDPGTRGRFVQDCDVCCRPWDVHVSRDERGGVYADVSRAQ